MIVGIVLAAGRSRRMGRPKAFLEIGGETFLDRAISFLSAGGCDQVVVVGPGTLPHGSEIGRAAKAGGATFVTNPDPESEQVDSLRLALEVAADGAAAALVTPVDTPWSGPAVVSGMIEVFRRSGAPLVIPTYAGERGHPILIARRLFPLVRSRGLEEGIRSLIRSHEEELLELPVADSGVLLDIDTPRDYRKLLERDG